MASKKKKERQRKDGKFILSENWVGGCINGSGDNSSDSDDNSSVGEILTEFSN